MLEGIGEYHMTYDKNRLVEAIFSSFTESLESFLFVEVETCEPIEKMPELEGQYMGMSVDIPEPGNMRFSVMMKKVQLKESFATISGSEDESGITDKILVDFLGELVNMVAGRFVADLFPEELKLGLPEFADRRSFFVDTGECMVEIRLEEYRCYAMVESI